MMLLNLFLTNLTLTLKSRLLDFFSQTIIQHKNILIMKIRKTQVKWITERYSNTQEMRRNTIRQSQAHSEKNTGRSNDGAPPFWVHGNDFTPQHRTAEAQSGHNTTQTHQAQVFFVFLIWRGSASEDQTYRRPPVTHHHYISAQYHHIPEVTLSRGN